MQKISLGFSPCPNDTFIFERFLQKDFQQEFEFETFIEDVERLNQMAFSEELDLTKMSFHTWLHLQDKYDILSSGAALGKGCGPLLIAKKDFKLNEVENLKIAIPGKFTTANFLLKSCFPEIKSTQEIIFSEIEHAVLNEDVDAGVIIHENRFTYQEKGLKKIIDLGEWWEQTTHCPIPLGCIAIHKKFSIDIKSKLEKLLRESVLWAYDKQPFISDFIKYHSQTMSEEVMKKHIDLYVNKFSIDLGDEGWHAINEMKKKFSLKN
jgi:1,4-dihydroxy-6-naphthoate synthase